MRAFVIALASLSLSSLAGCDLYWSGGGGGGGDDICAGAPVPVGEANVLQRDPNTGACVQQQTYSCPCGEQCNEPAEIITGSCSGTCENLDENDCLAASGCHAEYVESFTPAGTTGNLFQGCWDIEPAPVQEGGDCTQLDAYTCSFHDDCISVLDNGEFTACAAEPTAVDLCSGVDCGSGYACGVSCDAEGTCAPACVATGQIGTCTGDVTCNIAPPNCEAGTTPGVLGDCYSGYCIPNDECTSGCASFTTEKDCLSNNCEAVYQGSDCTCYSDGSCSCASETFENCQ